jgi:general secretion pathway protein K
MQLKNATRQQGIVLLIVLFFALLLSASIATFLKRATVDSILSRNRDFVARAEALARGGVEIGKALLIGDKVRETLNGGTGPLDSGLDRWALASRVLLTDHRGGSLRLEIEDEGTKLNLNSLFPAGDEATLPPRTEAFLLAFFERMIDELPVEVRALYEPRELSENLIDYVDADDTRISGGSEDDWYQSQSPPYRAENRPLLSVEEIGLIQGFDAELLDVIRPYVSVYPFAGGLGVNPNTAPPHILKMIFYNDGVDYRFIKDDDVYRIIDARSDGHVFCPSQTSEECLLIGEYLPNAGSIHPPLAYTSETFTIRSKARVGEVKRTVEAVVDRRVPTEPLLLSWRVW